MVGIGKKTSQHNTQLVSFINAFFFKSTNGIIFSINAVFVCMFFCLGLIIIYLY
jgi:hypothetical protein